MNHSWSHAGFEGLIGIGREDITPPVGIYARNWGAAKQDVAEGIHRPLTLTSLVLQNAADQKPFVLISMDLGWWRDLKDERFIREALIKELSLDQTNVMINLTHTHAAPSTCHENAHLPGGHLILPYCEKVRDAAIQATRKAMATKEPRVLVWNYGKCSLATNRDLKDPKAKRIICGFNPSGTADDTLLVGRVTDGTGKIYATIVNYACHPTTLAWDNHLISPDFVGAMREVVEAQTGKAPCLFLQGASGELSPREQYTGDTRIADAHGKELGFAVLSTLEGMLPPKTQLEFAGTVESGAPLATWSRTSQTYSNSLVGIYSEVEIPLKDLPSLEEIEKDFNSCTDRAVKERLNRKKSIRRKLGDRSEARQPLWGWRVGNSFILGQMDETYSWLQMELRRRFPEYPVVFMNLVNGTCGYQPPAELYDQDIYQVWQSPYARGCLERTLVGCESALQKLRSL